jgi:threonine dehydrogenase-like Zn-dependent dehydrogenase
MESNQATSENKSAGSVIVEKTMRTAVIVSPGKIQIEKKPLPEPASDELRIKLEGCGICGSDLPVWEGRPWFTYPMPAGAPGHEGFGMIDAMGNDMNDYKIGERVAILSYHAYAEYDIAKVNEVVRLPSFLENEPFPGEPLGCALNIFNRSDIGKKDVVAIIGAGFIGNLLIQLSKSAGAIVIAISQRDSSLQKAFESGADHVIKLDDHHQIIQKINEITNNQGCSRVIEATGKQWPLEIAGDIIAIKGKMIIAGFHQDGLRQINVQNWNWKGIDVVNAHERDPQEYIKGIHLAIEATRAGYVNPSVLYSHQFAFDDLEKAFEAMRLGEDGFVKGMVRM